MVIMLLYQRINEAKIKQSKSNKVANFLAERFIQVNRLQGFQWIRQNAMFYPRCLTSYGF